MFNILNCSMNVYSGIFTSLAHSLFGASTFRETFCIKGKKNCMNSKLGVSHDTWNYFNFCLHLLLFHNNPLILLHINLDRLIS